MLHIDAHGQRLFDKCVAVQAERDDLDAREHVRVQADGDWEDLWPQEDEKSQTAQTGAKKLLVPLCAHECEEVPGVKEESMD